MPVLELTSESLASHRAELTCAAIFATMLWPDDEAARRRWVETQTARFMAASLTGNPTAQAAAHTSLFDMALRATPPAVLDADARPRYERAFIAGETLLGALDSFAHDGRISLEALRQLQTLPARRKAHRVLDLSTQMLGRDWGEYRRVLHLWAAHHAAVLLGVDLHPPCSPARIVAFLASAHAIALAGCHYLKPNRRPAPLLDRRALWMVPVVHPDIAEVERAFAVMR